MLRRLDVLRDRQTLGPQGARLLADGRPHQVPRAGSGFRASLSTGCWVCDRLPTAGTWLSLTLALGEFSVANWGKQMSGELRINGLGECPFLFNTAGRSHTQAAPHGCLLWLLLLNEIRISS